MNHHPRGRTIRFQLLLAVNGVLLVFAFAFLLFDFQRALATRIEEKRSALQEEAKALLPGILRLKPHGLDMIQEYVDDVCGRMEDAESPHHHIAVKLDGEWIQARAHHRASGDLESWSKRPSKAKDQIIHTEGAEFVVGALSQDDTSVYISEDVAKVRWLVFAEEGRRTLGLILMGLLGAATVNFVLIRMVSRPLQILVDRVRRIGEGEFSSQEEELGSRELDYLSTELNAMSNALAESEQSSKQRLEKARQIQENLLPDDVQIPNVSVGKIYSPAEEVGGDYFDILPHGASSWLFCIADVTDHGVPAAMTAAMLKMLLLQSKNHAESPAAILRHMNQVFMEVNIFGDFASIIIMRIDLDSKTLTYANAGHDPAWLIDSSGKVSELQATGTLLGIVDGMEWKDITIDIADRCRIATSTDGITESFNAHGEQFGKQQLLEILLGNRTRCAAETAVIVDQRLHEFRGESPQTDDVTLLIIDLFPEEVAV